MAKILNIPNLTLSQNSKVQYYSQDRNGRMSNTYQPLNNLEDANTKIIGEFTTENLDFDLKHPVDIIVQDTYDGSTNMILNDGINEPRLVNNRFSVLDNNYLIPDRTGFKDTSLYDDATFQHDVRLKSYPIAIPDLEFKGLKSDSGRLGCGSYTFYFKLSDADGNETEVILESGIVQIFMGEDKNPQSMRMGLLDELTYKSVSFTISNIDAGFDYVHVYYSRSSSGESGAVATSYYKVNYEYPIKIGGVCDLTVTGFEPLVQTSYAEININYADINSTRTQTQYINRLLQGNTDVKVRDWDKIQQMTWRIIPGYKQDKVLGKINYNYTDNSSARATETFGYYSAHNVYYYTGYWPDEIYRFGIVYIFNDGALSPVINLQGVDLQKYVDDNGNLNDLYTTFYNSNKSYRCAYPEDYIFDETYKNNSKGVIRFPKASLFKQSGQYMQPTPMAITFDLSYMAREDADQGPQDLKQYLKDLDIKGFFFVRQKRIPSILAQGIAIDMTDKERGCLPVLQKGNRNLTKSFLDSNRLIQRDGSSVTVEENAISQSSKALLVPDAKLYQGMFSDIFNGTEFCLEETQTVKYMFNDEETLSYFSSIKPGSNDKYKATLTNVQEKVKITTDGQEYFSTMAGTPDEPTDVKNVNLIWNKSVPQDLTQSVSYVRGFWGQYVGVGRTSSSTNDLKYGNIYTIKRAQYFDDVDLAVTDDFKRYFLNSSESFKPISDRISIDKVDTVTSLDCYRGDCFLSVFTHRMMRNFEDPELPTNHDVVHPACWIENFGVKSSANILKLAKFALKKEDQGWYVEGTSSTSGTMSDSEYWEEYKNYLSKIDWNTVVLPKIGADQIEKNWFIENKDYVLILENNLFSKYNTLAETVTGDQAYYRKVENRTETIEINKDGTSSISPAISNVIPVMTFWEWMCENYIPEGDVKSMCNEIVPAFEVKIGRDPSKWSERRKVNPAEQEQNSGFSIKALFKNSANYELHGKANIIRADINAVGIGQWITFPIASHINLAMRDICFSQSLEEARHAKKRGFYPFNAMDIYENIPESQSINMASAISLPDRKYIVLPDVPYLKQEYQDRVYFSNVANGHDYQNGYKVTLESSFNDFTKEYGSITKLIGLGNTVLCVFKHGIAEISASENNVVGSIKILSDQYGSIWKDSVIETLPGCVVGVDTREKCVWMYTPSQGIQNISDQVIKTFLIDNLDISEFVETPLIGKVNVKTHFNADKNDIIFTYYNDTEALVKETMSTTEAYKLQDDLAPINDARRNLVVKQVKEGAFNESAFRWSICFNLLTKTWVTRYDWYPLESANIGGQFFTFNADDAYNMGQETAGQYMIPYSCNNIVRTNQVKSNIDPAFVDRTTSMRIPYSQIGNFTVYQSQDLLISSSYPGDEYWNNNVYALTFYAKGNAGNGIGIKLFQNNLAHVCFTPLTASVVFENDNWNFYTILFKYVSDRQYVSLLDMNIEFLDDEAAGDFYISEIKVTSLTEHKDVFDYSFLENKFATEEGGIFQLKNADLDYLYSLRNSTNTMKLWKHGVKGIYDNQELLLPTKWYGKQHDWWFEFVVKSDTMQLAIFNNFRLTSTKTAPYKFEYEVVGESYDWSKYKPVLYWINKNFTNIDDGYKEVLGHTYTYLAQKYADFPELESRSIPDKLPYIKIKFIDKQEHINKVNNKDWDFEDNTVETILIYDYRLNSEYIRTNQIGEDIKRVGRVKGNMQYLEDFWNVEIRPIAFKECTLVGGELSLSPYKESRHRDKYIKIKVRYTGEDLALIFNALTMFNYSYA